jgi:hypothetical protein
MLTFHVSLEQKFLQNLYINFSDLAAINWQYETITELKEPAKKSMVSNSCCHISNIEQIH